MCVYVQYMYKDKPNVRIGNLRGAGAVFECRPYDLRGSLDNDGIEDMLLCFTYV